MTKFKVGDKVASNCSHEPFFQAGERFVVVRVARTFSSDEGDLLDVVGGLGYYASHVIHGVHARRFYLDQALPGLKPAGTTLPIESAARKDYPLYRGLLMYFPAALAAVARVSKLGNDKHNPGQELHHSRGKSSDHADCILRHLIDAREDSGHGVGLDEQGVPHLAYAAWRALALLQEHLESQGAPLAPGAKLGTT